VSVFEVADGTTIVPLPIGARIRSVRRPHLTGRIEGYEWNAPGVLSAIPYRIAWDDSSRACDELGWFWFYAIPEGIEALPDAAGGSGR
jgi:hypothetical protein